MSSRSEAFQIQISPEAQGLVQEDGDATVLRQDLGEFLPGNEAFEPGENKGWDECSDQTEKLSLEFKKCKNI